MEKAHALVSAPPTDRGTKKKIRGRDHSAQLVELCFLSVVERFHEWWGELVPTTAALIQDPWSL